MGLIGISVYVPENPKSGTYNGIFVYLCGKLLTMLTEKEKENFFKNIDMLTIVPDRYNGSSHKGLRFIAFMLDYYDLPDGWCGSDFEEREFWDNYQGHAGFGKTPNDAAVDLAEKLKEAGVVYFFKD